MIPALIFYLIKRFNWKLNTPKISAIKKLKKLVRLKTALFLVVIISLFAFTSLEEHKALTYNVVKNNDVIGTITLNKNTIGDSIIFTLESHIKATFLFEFNIIGKEKSIYKNTTLVYSSVFRTLNNKVKANHQIVLKKGAYHLQSNESTQAVNLNCIKQNLVKLYFKEPIGLTSVFCDNLKKTVKVKPLGNSKYMVDFSKGKYNIFHYKNGKCIKIEAKSKLFNVTIIPAVS